MEVLCVSWLSEKYQQIKGEQTFALAMAFVPALLGIAYPIIIQTIGRLSDQYKSSSIAERFRNETYHKLLFWLLVISAFTTIIAIIFNDLLFLSFLSVIALVAVFFRSLQLLQTYQSAGDLFNYYLRDYKLGENIDRAYKKKDVKKILDEMHYSWPSMTALMVHAISTGDIKLQEDIRSKFINQAIFFIKYIDQKDAEYVQFPADLHNKVYEILAAYIKHRDSANYQGFDSLVGSGFFSDDFDNKIVNFTHSNTYYAIWKNLTLMIEHDRFDKVLRYWGSAHQHCLHKFSSPNIRYNKDMSETGRSQMLQQIIHKHRKAFLQFHFVLAAHVMHKKKFKELRQLWDYTQSQPPTYVLVPQTMNDVFGYYFYFLDLGYGSTDLTIQYWFTDLRFDAMNGQTDVKTIARKYACLLFLRQWVRQSYYGIDPLTPPRLPADLDEKKMWHDRIDGFKRMTQKLLDDTSLLKGCGLSGITKENCLKDSKPYPIDFLENLKERLAKDYDHTLKVIELDKEKLKEIDSNTIESVKLAYNDFKRINGKEIQESDKDLVSNNDPFIRGRRHLMEKLSLVKNSGVSYLGYETEIGARIKENYYVKASIKFHGNTTTRYTVPNGKLFEAVDKLKLDPTIHSVVAFYSNIFYIKEYQNIIAEDGSGGVDFFYKSIPFYCFTGAIQFANDTLYVLKKEDFPMIKHVDWKDVSTLGKQIQKKWKDLSEINSDLKIYREFYVLTAHEELKKEYLSKGYLEEDLEDKVEAVFDFLSIFWFRNGIKIVSISEGEIFQEGGDLMSLDGIQPF